MIGRSLRGFAFVGVAFAVAGCPQKHEAATDAATSAAPVASSSAPAAPAPEAANEGDIKRYPGVETKLDHVPATILAYVATVRSDASSGASLVAALKKGTDAVKIAQKDTFYLITFTDPGSPGRKVMGWVDQKAFVAVIWDASKHFITCPAPQKAIVLDIGEQCVTPCDPNNDTCAAGQACNGDAPRSNQGQAGDNIEFCVVGVKKGGTPTPPATTDAGTTPTPSSTPSSTPDAAAPPSTAKKAFAHAPDAGACPAGFVQAGNFCRAKCTVATAATDCIAGASCKSFQGQFACADGL